MPAADRRRTRPRIAAARPGTAGLLHLAEPYSSGGSLSPWPGVDLPALAWATSALLIATSVLVPVVRGWLALRPPDAGLAVLGVAAVASLPTAVWVLRDTIDGAGSLSHAVNAGVAALLQTPWPCW